MHALSDYNIISRNNVANNNDSIVLYRSRNNVISENDITNNWDHGIYLDMSFDNKIYHNNFIDNGPPFLYSSTNMWDDGYSSSGNYWSDYADRYPNASEIAGSGIWNTSYEISESNQDNYPFVHIVPEFQSFMIMPLFIIATLLAVMLYRRKHPM